MKEKKIKALDGTIVTQLIPESEADRRMLDRMEKDGELESKASFADFEDEEGDDLGFE